MPKTLVSGLCSGMKLCKTVFNNNGSILLVKGTVLNERYINKLKFFDIKEVAVEEKMHQIPTTKCEAIYKDAISAIKTVMEEVNKCTEIKVSIVTETVASIIDTIYNDLSAFITITGLRDKDNYTFLHSVDVCIFSIIIGKKLSFSKDELLSLGTGALLHDIGKTKINDSILLKSGRLNNDEFSIIKKHSIYGYEIIREKTNLNNRIATTVLHHHEKWDGSGYPLGIEGKYIQSHARIITIADIYDALTADRVYRKRFLPHQAAEYIIGNSNRLLDPDLVKVFIENIPIYPVGAKVVLTTGEIAKVIKVRKSIPYRPEVRVFAHVMDNKFIQPYDIDLFTHANISITDVI